MNSLSSHRPWVISALISVAALSHGQAVPKVALSAVHMNLPSVQQGATLVSHASTSKMLNMTISLAPAHRAAFQAFANAVSDPRSPDYHRFLTPAQIGERFGASTATVNATVAYLKSKGMQITMTADSHLAILFRGRVDQVESAFSTKINNYKVASRKTKGPLQFFSYATPPKVPATFSSSVITIQGLDNANPPIARTSALRPQDGRAVYNATPLYGTSAVGGHKGEGINIGITNFDGYRISNAAVLGTSFGLPAPSGGYGSNIHKRIVGGTDGETVAEGAEGDLDFQMVLCNAPKADIYIYDGIGGGLIATLAQEAQDNIVDIVSESYGFAAGDDFYLAAHDQHLAMTIQGITYMGASGDNGTADMINDPYPDFDPDVLMVGGSDVTLNGQGTRGSELGWNGSGSGWYQGAISFNVLPPYQVGTTVPTSPDRRLIPDIALHATNWFFSFGNAINNVGGTSASSPNFAGQLGIILQTLIENGGGDVAGNGRTRVGRVMDVFYGLDGDPSAFLDLLGGDAGALPDGTESVGKAGWDFVTGWGAPDDEGIFNAYLSTSSLSLVDNAMSAGVYTVPSPTLTLGTNPQGDATDLSSNDGVSYSVLSVKQTGVGQVAAATIAVPLQTSQVRRSASLTVAMSTPSLTTGYVYLLNKNTGQYDLQKTVTGTGATNSLTIQLDVTSSGLYIANDSTVTLLVRALKPTRLGNTAFNLKVDQVIATEKVARGS